MRAAAIWTTLAWSMGAGLAILLPLVLVLSGPPDGPAEWRAVGFAVVSGLCEAAGLACLLRGLVTGSLSIMSSCTNGSRASSTWAQRSPESR